MWTTVYMPTTEGWNKKCNLVILIMINQPSLYWYQVNIFQKSILKDMQVNRRGSENKKQKIKPLCWKNHRPIFWRQL